MRPSVLPRRLSLEPEPARPYADRLHAEGGPRLAGEDSMGVGRFSLNLEGEVLEGRFRVGAPLARGGMASVYRAEDLTLGQTVVVKVPLPEVLLLEGFRARFQHEIAGLLTLRHPHVVHALSRGEHHEIPYLVLEYLEGGSLADRLRGSPGQRLALDEVVAWLPDVAETLDFIHGQGVVHRDVKPGNILFDRHGNVFLSDFGIAKAVGGTRTGMTLTGGVVGSPDYLAPEQGSGEGAVTGKADQYALGVTVYEALSGRRPYSGTTPLQVMFQKQVGPPLHLSEVAPHLSSWCAAAVMRALAPQPSDRFGTCAEFVRAMLAPSGPSPVDRASSTDGASPLARGAQPDVVRASPSGRAASPGRRWRARGAWVGVAVLVTAATWAFSRTGSDPSLPPPTAPPVSSGAPRSPAESAEVVAPEPSRPLEAVPVAPAPPALATSSPLEPDARIARTAAREASTAWAAWLKTQPGLEAPPSAAAAAETGSRAEAAWLEGQHEEALSLYRAEREQWLAARDEAERALVAEVASVRSGAEAAAARLGALIEALRQRAREAAEEVGQQAKADLASPDAAGRAGRRTTIRRLEQRARQWRRILEVAEREVLAGADAANAAQARAAADVHMSGGRQAEARTAWTAALQGYERSVAAATAFTLEVNEALSTQAHGRSPLHAAGLAAAAPAVRRLLDLGADPDATDDDGATPAHLAAWSGSVEVLEALRQGGAQLSAIAARWRADPLATPGVPSGWRDVTPACIAALAGRVEALEHLLKSGADRSALADWYDGPPEEHRPESQRFTLLHAAASGGDAACVALLLDNGFDVGALSRFGVTPLHAAAHLGSGESVRALLAGRAQLEAKTESGWTALHFAARRADPAVLETLIAAGAKVDAAAGDASTPLHGAAGAGRVECIRLLVKAGAKFLPGGESGGLPVHTAASAGQVPSLEALRAAGARLDAPDNQQHQPIHTAAQADQVEAIEALLRMGAKEDAKAHEQFTLIHEAAGHGSPRVLDWLLARGWDIERRAEGGVTPLHVACKEGQLDMVKLLVARGARRDAVGGFGERPFHQAAWSGQVEVLRWLVEKGEAPAVLQRSPEGWWRNALHIAAYRNQPEVAAYLLGVGVDIEGLDSVGRTPLWCAVEERCLDVAKTLLDAGASATPRFGQDGRTPLHFAALAGHVATIQLLVQRGVSTEVLDKNGATPLIWAADNGQLEAVRSLIALGASVQARTPGGVTALYAADSEGHREVAAYLRSLGAR